MLQLPCTQTYKNTSTKNVNPTLAMLETFTPADATCAAYAWFVCSADINACVATPCHFSAVGCTDLPPPAGSDASGRVCNCNSGFTYVNETYGCVGECGAVKFTRLWTHVLCLWQECAVCVWGGGCARKVSASVYGAADGVRCFEQTLEASLT
jgi:hypothetical protein